MSTYIRYFEQIDKTDLPLVGGKGANLGEMHKAGFPVPDGFCITTSAYSSFIRNSIEMEEYFAQLDNLNVDNLKLVQELGDNIRSFMEELPIPPEIEGNIIEALHKAGRDYNYAVRSSATAEDLPSHSFAGQQETFLNVKGEEQLLYYVRKCWASLFTDRAIAYRSKNGFNHRKIQLSVVVQQMIHSEVSGIMFTADPISGNRNIAAIDASFGLGEALVSGLVSADLYLVQSTNIINKQIAEKKLAIYPDEEKGTVTATITGDKSFEQALTDEKIIELANLGKKIEHHYKTPQDIEWCLSNDKLYIVQARPITSLYPAITTSDDKLHLYYSFGHQQMMTEAMKPLAISVLRTTIPFGKNDEIKSESNTFLPAGGRLYVDITDLLSFKFMRKMLPKSLSQVDELISSAIEEVIQREDFLRNATANKELLRATVKNMLPIFIKVLKNLWIKDTSSSIRIADAFVETTVIKFKESLENKSGIERIELIQENLGLIFIRAINFLIPYPFAGIAANKLLAKYSLKWLGDNEEIKLLNRSLQGNVTSEMGLALGDLADIARNHLSVLEYLVKADDKTFYDRLDNINGGKEFKVAFEDFIKKYGMRCPGEIDITKPRWCEEPTQLVPSILSQVDSANYREHRTKFLLGEIDANEAAKKLLERVRQTRGGIFKVKIVSRLIKVFRDVMGIREHGKFLLIQVLDINKKNILEEAKKLVTKGILREETDVFYFSLQELKEIIAGEFNQNIAEVLEKRKQDYIRYQQLTPPRVMTNEGEIIFGKRDVEAPDGALIGTPVSTGIIEGYARVVLNPRDAKLKKGEILVAPFTDPGWTPLFLSATGLIMEVGGLMTHGAVVAREYGIPAVVSVEDATKIIKDGDYIRVNGNEGYVEILNNVIK